MSLSSYNLPPNILKCMNQEARKQLGKAGMLSEELSAAESLRYEKKLQEQIKALLRRLGIEANVSRMDRAKTDRTGWPDIVFAINGHAVAVECKSPEGKLTEEQEQLRITMTSKPNCWKYFVVRSYDQMTAVLRSLGIEI